jgi:hypothetical protein
LRIASITLSSVSRSALDVEEVAATAAGMTARRAGVGAVTRWRAAGAGVAIGGGSEGEASSRAGAVAAAGGTVGGTVWRATGRSLGIGKLCFDEEEAAFGGWESGCLAGAAPFLASEGALAAEGVLAEEVLAGAAAFCGFSAEGAAGSEFASEKERISVRTAVKTVDSGVDCKGLCKALARTRGLTAFLRCESIANLTETAH